MQPSTSAQPVGLSVVMAKTEGPGARLTKVEILGYEALRSNDRDKAQAYFAATVKAQPLTAFRVVEACCKAKAPAVGQSILDLVGDKMQRDPTCGTQVQRLRCAADRLVVRVAGCTASQLLAGNEAAGDRQAVPGAALRRLQASDKNLVDEVRTCVRPALLAAPTYTLEVLLLLARLGIFCDRRHQDDLQAIVVAFLCPASQQTTVLQRQRLDALWQRTCAAFARANSQVPQRARPALRPKLTATPPVPAPRQGLPAPKTGCPDLPAANV